MTPRNVARHLGTAGAVLALVAGCATPGASSPPPSSPATRTPAATVSPSGSPAPKPATTQPPLDPAGATWIRLGSAPSAGAPAGSSILSIVGFAGGYAATGSLEGRGPAAWFSPDGVTWTAAPLGSLVVNCPDWGPEGDETAGRLVPDADQRAIATDGTEVVIVGEVGDYAGQPCGRLRPVAWHSADGRTWQRSDPFPAEAGDLRAIAVWAVQGGWQAASETALWASPDGLAWERIGDRPTGAEVIAGAPDGTVLATTLDPDSGRRDLLVSSDGRAWTSADAPDGFCGGITQIVPPALMGRDDWVFVGDLRLCTSPDLARWFATSFDPAVPGAEPTAFGVAGQTRYGAIAVGDACFGAGSTCEPDPRAWILVDEEVWVPLAHPPVFWERSLADGPAGVLMIGTATGEGPKDVWRLDP